MLANILYTGESGSWRFWVCNSTDAKPLNPQNDDVCYEKDTAETYVAEGGLWVVKRNVAYTSLTHNHDLAYSALTHNHNASYEAAGAVATHAAAADPHTGYQKESEKGAANGYASLDAGGKVPSAQLPASGSDPWTYIKLAADFTTSSGTAVDITGLAFTPAANTQYEFEAILLLRTATATVNPRPGLAWPTGMTDGVADLDIAQTASTTLLARGNIGAALLGAVGGLPNTTQSWPAKLKGTVIAGASPSGTVKLQLASETAGTNVTVKAGSYLAYRVI